MKNFTSVNDVPDVLKLIEEARSMKANPFAYKAYGENKTLGLLFFNPSLRTRMSTQRAAQNLGMNVISLNFQNDGWQLELEDGTVMDQGAQEHIREAAAVVSQYCDVIGLRAFPSLQNREDDYEDRVLKKFIAHATVPVLSLESSILHPLQSLADLITIAEYQKKSRPKVVLTWAPHPKALPQAVANSFAEWIQHYPADFCIANPAGFDLAHEFRKDVQVFHNQDEALAEADFVYVKNWSSYENYGQIGRGFEDWMVTTEKLKLANEDAKVMHCLPVRRNVVISDSVLDSDTSLVIEQANNRTFSAQTVLLNLLKA
ncbi:MAG: acetylornithine carbamoyltransferase [Bacteroidota bacterium]